MKKLVPEVVAWQIQSLICPECVLIALKPRCIPMHATEEGWGEMCCDICRRKLRDVVPGYEGSEAEVPRDLRDLKE